MRALLKDMNFETFILAIVAGFIGVPALLNGVHLLFLDIAHSIVDNGGSIIMYTIALFFIAVLVWGAAIIAMNLKRTAALGKIEIEKARMFVEPDINGRLPIAVEHLQNPVVTLDVLKTYMASFSPNLSHYSYNPQSTAVPAPAPPTVVDVQPGKVVQPDNFWTLYQNGGLPKERFLLGYNLDEDGAEITATWKDLYSALIGGKSGMGKSTLIRNILAQSALQGGRFVVIDPHFNSGDESLGASLQPLAHLMLCDVACEEDKIIEALGFVTNIGKQRLAGKDMSRWPLILIVDETTALFKRSSVASELTKALAQIAEETRKVGVYAMCIGQNFDGRIIDTTVRNSFVSMLSMRARKDVARVQTGSNEFATMAETLTLGQAVWMTPQGDMYRMSVPNCTEADLELVAHASSHERGTRVRKNRPPQVVETPSDPSSNRLPNEESQGILEDGSEGGSEGVSLTDPKVQTVLSLVREGKTQTDILRDVWGVKSSGGRKYQAAAEEYRSILATVINRVVA